MDTPAPQSETSSAPTLTRACESCDYWFTERYQDGDPVFPHNPGQCRRYAPREADLVKTYSNFWCGEYISKDTRMATEGQALATIKGIALELQHAGEALEAAAEELKAKGCGMGANKAWAAKKRAYEVAGGYL